MLNYCFRTWCLLWRVFVLLAAARCASLLSLFAANEREAAQYLKDCCLQPDQMGSDSKPPTELRHHIYVDETGNWLRKATKLSNGAWRQHRWENEQWKPKAQGIRNVPYGLDRLIEDTSDKICFIFEGEKDVERAWRYSSDILSLA